MVHFTCNSKSSLAYTVACSTNINTKYSSIKDAFCWFVEYQGALKQKSVKQTDVNQGRGVLFKLMEYIRGGSNEI
jgi:hypothetical protein